MDPEQKTAIPPGRQDSDADIGFLLYKVGATLKSFFILIGKILARFGRLIAALFLFWFKNLAWISLGLLLGLAYGSYLYMNSGPGYSSEMVVKTNFQSSRALYSSLSYFNTLIGTSNVNQLSAIFGIKADEAKKLVSFSAQPIEDDLSTNDLYRDRFMPNRVNIIKRDTFWTRPMPYKEFKNNLNKFDYTVHEISIVSRDQNIFAKMTEGLKKYISSNATLEKLRRAKQASNIKEEKILLAAIDGLDSLRQTYNIRLRKDFPLDNQRTGGLVLQGPTPIVEAPELELYDKLLELKDELSDFREKAILEDEIIETISGFNPTGQRISVLRENTIRFGIIGIVLATLVVSIIGIFAKMIAYRKLIRKP